jgi:toluene monooxygenase electron transfer component
LGWNDSKGAQAAADDCRNRSLTMPNITVESPREVVTIECGVDETLLSAGLRAGIGLPYECCSGICGTCRFEITAGEVWSQWPAAPGLSPRDRRLNRNLACQSRPLTDCAIRLRLDPKYVPTIRPRHMTGVLRAVETVTSDIRRVTVTTGSAAEFLAGQFILLHLPDLAATRAYSMSNTPNGEGTWEFYIKQIPSGEFTEVLFSNAVPGASVKLEGPYGMAYLRPASNRPVLCVAGGSGISPMLSIARALARDRMAQPLHFYVGGRAPGDVSALLRIAEAACGSCAFQLRAAVSEVGSVADWKGEVGKIHALVERDLAERLGDFDIYLAGPPAMVQACLAMLSRYDVAADRVHYDAY